MKIYLASIILYFAPLALLAQPNSIEGEIMNYRDTASELIKNGRRMLFDNLKAGDLAKAKQVKDFLVNDPSTRGRKLFHDNEYPLLLYWTKEYPELLLDTVRPFISSTAMHSSGRADLVYDDMYYNLWKLSAEAEQKLIGFIDAADLPDMEKDYLRLNFKNELLSHHGYSNKYDTVQSMAAALVKKYPGTVYTEKTQKKYGLDMERDKKQSRIRHKKIYSDKSGVYW